MLIVFSPEQVSSPKLFETISPRSIIFRPDWKVILLVGCGDKFRARQGWGHFIPLLLFFRGGGKFRNVEEKGTWKYLRMVESSKNQLSEKWRQWMSCWFVTCSQCYNPFTGLYLQVCKNRPISQSFVAVNIDKFNTLMIALTL